MENVEFDSEQGNRILYSKLQSSSTRPGLVKFLINKDIVKTESQANFILLGVVVVCAIAAVMFIRSMNTGTTFTVQEVINSTQ